jgi:putative flippase GtrA
MTDGLVGFVVDDWSGVGRAMAFAPPTTTTSCRGGRDIMPTLPPHPRRSRANITRPSSKVDDPLTIRTPRPSPPARRPPDWEVRDLQFRTLVRILLPSLLSSIVACVIFPPLSLSLSYLINDSATFAVLSVDSSQFVQNFLTVTGLTFSILVGQTYYFMYQQQEAVYISLFREVTEAKSLLEQVSLVCRGRRDMYVVCLNAMRRYVPFVRV